MKALSVFLGVIGLALMMICQSAQAQQADDLSLLKTFGTAGKELRPMADGKEGVLFQRDGAGCLTHMWFGGNFNGWEKTRIRVYVDGEANASIDMELGMGHGIGFGDQDAPWGIARMGKIGHGNGIYNTFRIPFSNGVRVTAQMGKGIAGNPDFWWIIRGTENLPITVGGVKLPPQARLHLYKREDYTAQPLEEFDLCNTSKAGALYLVVIAARCADGNFNYLEAQMRGYLNGAKEPVMLSSGLEDYFLGTYYFDRGRYHTPISGLTHFDPKDHSFSAYRFHDDDPIFFQKGLRLTCRCGEKAGNHTFGNPKATTYTTYAWLYEW